MKSAFRALALLAGVALGFFVVTFSRCGEPEVLGGPLSAQGGAPVSSFAGVVDPTSSAFAGGMIACSSSCSSALGDQNAAALQAAIDYAASHAVTLFIPPGQYPLTRVSGQAYAINIAGDSNVTIDAHNVTLRAQGNAGGTDFALIQFKNGGHLRISGLILSQRDVTSATTSSPMLKVGDGGTTAADDLQLIDTQYIEGVGGDCIRLDGGTSALTVTRIQIQRARFEGCARAGVDVRPGVGRLSVTYSWFKANASRDIFFESPGDGPIGTSTIAGNTFERSGGVALELAGNGGANSAEQIVVEYNRIINGVVKASALGRASIRANAITFAAAGDATALVDLSGKIYDVWVSDNYLLRDSTAANGSAIKTAASGGAVATNLVVRGNRVYQYSGAAPGIDLSAAARFLATENNITYHASTADSGSTGFVGIYCAGASSAPCSGVVSRNRVKRDLQADGVTSAGRMLAGVGAVLGASTTVGRMTVRDNVVDGAASGYYLDADGAAYSDGVPLISGNVLQNCAAEVAGGVTTYRTETTSDAEVVSSGALAITKRMHFLATSGSKSYTLADAAVDGIIHCIKIYSATSTPSGTLTPAHFADGTTHTITWSGPGYACLAWDATAGTYRLLGSSGVTLN